MAYWGFINHGVSVMSKYPSISRAQELIEYNSDTGSFSRLRKVSGARKAVGSIHPEGYMAVTIDYIPVKAQVLAWALTRGAWPRDGEAIVHINDDRLDNRLSNLKCVERCPSHKVEDLYVYNPDTGKFSWKYEASHNGKKLTGVPGWLSTSGGYYQLSAGNRQIMGHRVAHILMTGSDVPRGHEIDHINGNRSDNRWSNLRVVSRTQNNMNSKMRCDNASGVKGVCFSKSRQKWEAEIKADCKRYRLGRFDTLEEAAAARIAAEKRIFGEYRRETRTDK